MYSNNRIIILLFIALLFSPLSLNAFAVDPKILVKDVVIDQATNPFEIKLTNNTYVYQIDSDGVIITGKIQNYNQLPSSTASRVLVTDSSGYISVSSITTTLLEFLSTVSSNIQDQLNAKYSATNRQTSITDSELSSGIDAVKIGAGGVTSTEFGYIGTLSSNAQDQINGKQASLGYTAGTLDDVHLEGTEISNSRTNLNYNDTSVINFNVQDTSGLDMANVTATIVTGSIGDTQLGTSIDTTQLGGGGVTSTEFDFLADVTSLIQAQFTGKQSISEKNQNNGYAGLGSSGQLQKAQQNATTVYTNQANTYSGAGTQDYAGSILDNVASINDNSGAESTSGFIDLANAVLVCWEQAPAGADICISVDANEDYLLDTDARNFNFN